MHFGHHFFRTRRRIAAIESDLVEIRQHLESLELSIDKSAPSSEVERLNHAFDLIAARAPISEVDRLNKAFELIADRAPISEVERLDHAFELIANRAPISEVERLNHAFDMISQLVHRAELRDLIVNYRPSERAVEVPWVLSKYVDETRVLEIGHAFAEDYYLRSLGALRIPLLVGLDPAASPRSPSTLQPFLQVRGDVLQHCFKPASFDLILCVSTIEHIGRDNTVYGLDSGRDIEYPDIVAIKNMGDWLAPRGRLLVTVPFGRYEDHGWLINYDIERLDALIDASALRPVEQRFYGWMPGGWREVEPEILAGRGYQSLGASHAAGVALVELQKVSEAS